MFKDLLIPVDQFSLVPHRAVKDKNLFRVAYHNITNDFILIKDPITFNEYRYIITNHSVKSKLQTITNHSVKSKLQTVTGKTQQIEGTGKTLTVACQKALEVLKTNLPEQEWIQVQHNLKRQSRNYYFAQHNVVHQDKSSPIIIKGKSGAWVFDYALKHRVAALENADIKQLEFTYNTKREALITIHEMVAEHLNLFYDEPTYQNFKQIPDKVCPVKAIHNSYWWCYFVHPSVDLNNVFK